MTWKKILSFTLFKIITVSASSTLLRVILMGRSGCPTKGGNLGGSPWKPKSLNFPLLLDITPTKKIESPWSQTTYWEKVSLITFRQILPKILPEACIFSNIVMTYLKKFVGTKFLKQHDGILSRRDLSGYWRYNIQLCMFILENLLQNNPSSQSLERYFSVFL